MSVSDTSAIPVGLRSRVPMKITSSMRAPRRLLADCSPRTQEIASEMFDLPQPLGPTMAATPSPWNFNSVRSQKDLNPRICSFFNLSKTHSFDPVPAFRLSGASQSRVHLRLEQGKGPIPAPVGREADSHNVPAKLLPVKHPAPIYGAFGIVTPAYRTRNAATACMAPNLLNCKGVEEVVENREPRPE